VTMIECGEHSGDVEEAEHSHGAICIKTRVALACLVVPGRRDSSRQKYGT
jgi:hypothetical protein